MCGHAMKPASVFDINGTGHGTEIVRQEAQDVFTKLPDWLLAGDGCSQAELCISQPLLAFLRQCGFANKCGDRERQDYAPSAPDASALAHAMM